MVGGAIKCLSEWVSGHVSLGKISFSKHGCFPFQYFILSELFHNSAHWIRALSLISQKDFFWSHCFAVYCMILYLIYFHLIILHHTLVYCIVLQCVVKL